MAKSTVRLDYRQLEKFKKELQKHCTQEQQDEFFKSCVKELAARLIAKVVKRTPVGRYPEGSGKVGGTLRRGWTALTPAEAESGKGNGKNAAEWAQSLKVVKEGSNYVITVTNPVEYASYVEYGHRTSNHKGWVEGQFMLTISENEIRTSAPQILEKKLTDYMKGMVK